MSKLFLYGEALLLMAVFSLAYVIYARFCSSIPAPVAIMYLMLFSLAGWLIDVLRPEIEKSADASVAYPPALRNNLRSLLNEGVTILRNGRALMLLFFAGVLWYFYWFVLFSTVKSAGVFVVLILLQVPLIFGPISMILSFQGERNQLRSIPVFLMGILLVFFGVLIHKFAKGAYGFDWGALIFAVLLLVLVLLNKLIRVHLIKHISDFGQWSRLHQPLSVRIFFLFNFVIAFLVSLIVALFYSEPLPITLVQSVAMGFLGIVPTALCGLWESRLGHRLGSFAVLEGFHGLKTGLSVPLDLVISLPCGGFQVLACIGGPAGLPDLWYICGFCCTLLGVTVGFWQIRDA